MIKIRAKPRSIFEESDFIRLLFLKFIIKKEEKRVNNYKCRYLEKD
jgi:hypothetical protein